MRIGIRSLLAATLALLGGQAEGLCAETKARAGAGAEFREVYDLVRAHLAGATEGELNAAAVQGLVSALGPRVALVTNGAAARAAAEIPLVSKSEVFDGDILYLRVGRVGAGLVGAITQAYSKPGTTNKLSGLALDLRYAAGADYAAAAAAADLFARKEQALLDWGNGIVKSKAGKDAISVPVAVLVNRQTAGAAEALAAVLRQTGAGLVLGGRTAGQAMVWQEFALKNGERLRIATGSVQLGDGTAMPEDGLKPDITVEVSPEAELAFYADAYRAGDQASPMAGTGVASTNQAAGTNRTARRARFNEADLVRERREGISEADLLAMRQREADKPMVQDPALARALDLLRGLAVVRGGRS